MDPHFFSEKKNCMEGFQLHCGCGSTMIAPHKVDFVSGWCDTEAIVQTVLKTGLPNEDPNTLVAQKRLRHDDVERNQPPFEGVACKLQVHYYCYACKRWDNVFTLNEAMPSDAADFAITTASWKPSTKKQKKGKK